MRIRTGVALAASVALVAAVNAHAATFTVTRLDDPAPGACDSDCSLREAVIAANAGPGGDTIMIPAGRFRLTLGGINEDAAATGDLDLTKSTTVTGAGARLTVIDGATIDRVLEIGAAASVSISDLTITGGLVQSGGGGILNKGTLSLLRTTVSDNAVFLPSCACYGGGIFSIGPLAVAESTIARNRGSNGGGIAYAAALVVARSTISDNLAGGPGWNGVGGGLMGDTASTLTLTNSTIARNQAFNSSGAGGGIGAPRAVLSSTIVAENFAHETDQSAIYLDNCGTGITLTSNGHNLSDGSDCGFTAPGDRQNIAAKLGPLRDNGGATDTVALLPGSGAIDAGGNSCGTFDQRGTTRPRGNDCDIGAYEFAPPIVTTTPALSIGLTSASLRGTIYPSTAGTGYFFEYGTTAAYGSDTQLQWSPPASLGQFSVSALVAGLKQGTTYHFRLAAYNDDGSSRGADQVFTTNDRTKPVLTLLKVGPGIFRAAKGTTISFTLSEAATVTFKVDRVLPGLRKGRRCVARTARLRRGRACTRYVPVKGTLIVAGKAGGNTFRFDARLGGKTLRPGAYRLSARPTDPGLNVGKTVITAFRVRR
jgi:CSLREA domain-containing protein